MTDADALKKPSAERQALIELAVEGWRLCRSLERTLARIDEASRRRAASQLRWHERSVESALASAALRLVDLAAQPFDAGLPATPLNLDDFDSDDALVVDYMLEPVILGADGVVRVGTVILRKDTP